ncbi:hypothetical protein CRENBAI_004488 [Crenichthys baileyi]|uniref:Uncharacterized protein n=1 Tax=Crenichthys baileyi TaxID=28760 RepID=A0AAV9S1Q8_9TELE
MGEQSLRPEDPPLASHRAPRLFRSVALLRREEAALPAEDGDCMEAAKEPAELITVEEERTYTHPEP